MALFIFMAIESIAAQRPNKVPRLRRPSDGSAKQSADEEKKLNLPDDPKLLALHKEFVIKADRLAKEYERKGDYEKAKAVCKEILKLVPNYPKAQELLKEIDNAELIAERKVIDIFANRSWQDTGIQVIAGKPIHIEAKGTWTFHMDHVLGPEGMEIPKELRGFKLGSLLGMIATGDPKKNKPFYVGGKKRLVASSPGRLFLKMHDSDTSDNSGKLTVEIRGTFDER